MIFNLFFYLDGSIVCVRVRGGSLTQHLVQEFSSVLLRHNDNFAENAASILMRHILRMPSYAFVCPRMPSYALVCPRMRVSPVTELNLLSQLRRMQSPKKIVRISVNLLSTSIINLQNFALKTPNLLFVVKICYYIMTFYIKKNIPPVLK